MPPSALRGRTLAVYLFCVAVWGSTWLVIRVGVREIPPLTFAGLRMGLACLLLIPLAWRRSRIPTSAVEWRFIALSGLLQIGLSYAGIFVAARWIESGLSALLFCSFPIWVAVFGHVLLPDEPLTARGTVAASLGLAGVCVIEGPAAVRAMAGQTGPVFWGGLLVLGSAVTSAYANVLMKKRLARVPPARNLWGQTLVGSVLLFAFAALFERGAVFRWTPGSLAALAYLVVFGTVFTFIGLFWLLPRVPVAVIGTIPLMDMLIAVVLGAVILGEALPARVFLGGVLILAGVILTSRAPGRSAARSERSLGPGTRES